MKQDPSGHIALADAAGEPPQRLAQLLSALADGEAGTTEVDEACLAWREGEACGTWHAYQLIGDVLRSEALAADAQADAAFVRRLRSRLADQPVVLAPVAGAARVAALARRRWSAPAAVAAGVLAVAGATVMLRQGGVPTTQAPAALAAASAPVTQVATDASPKLVGDVVRDAELDRYLAAHRRYAGRSLMAEPEGLRQVVVMDR